MGGPVPLAAATAGFLGASALLWRDLPIAPGPRARVFAAGAGATALLAGLGLYLAGMSALGPAYDVSSTFGARLHQGQRLVTSGPFAVVRHPMYAGLAVAAVGGLLLYRTWATLAFVVSLRVVAVRARREEATLADEFGAEWKAYRERVPRWLPRWASADIAETLPRIPAAELT
ncbi:MAG: isoprenylcysteine carboxylmethyltransferase family protein [Chloroflexi bacterium]|nr:isoprenylcysteine carboxylmethyltransferase family protein [Chloroflexota bacterium]MDA8237962.1 isoprenylcysteine carboxylmethyltransferase family protein [Chloroflexota bacterium]